MNTGKIGMYIRPKLCVEHQNRISIIDSHDFSKVERKMKELYPFMTEEYITRGIFALKQYYASALFDPSNGHAISKEIDPFWHVHMLFSKEYQGFCEAVVGEFMHHKPLERSSKKEMAKARRLYRYTIQVLENVFTKLDKHFWPKKNVDAHTICFHFGNGSMYTQIQAFRLFAPRGHAYEV